MRFYGITMEGKYKAQTVVNASALVWSSSDERRMVYDQVTENLWIADSSDWKNAGLNGDIPIGTEMWIYANAPPDGWLLNGTPSDDLLAVKGGGIYTPGGGAAKGNFTLPLHSHNMSNHTHIVSGNTNVMSESSKEEGENDNTDMIDQNHYHTFSFSSTIGSPGTTDPGAGTGYRPEAAVGLICTKT